MSIAFGSIGGIRGQKLPRATSAHSPAYTIRGIPFASLRVCKRQPALRLAKPARTDARQTKLFATVRLPGTLVAFVPASLLPASAGVRARIPLRETPLRAPVHSPGPGAVPRTPTVPRTETRHGAKVYVSGDMNTK